MIEYTIDCERALVCARITEQISPTDLMEYIQRLWRDDAFQPTYNAIITIDVDDAEPVLRPPMLTDWRQILEEYARRRAGAKWAFVVPQALRRRIIGEAFAQMDMGTLQVMVFTTAEEAEAWLAESNG